MIFLNFKNAKIADKIGIVMLNMGGPADVKAVKPFLRNMFSDADLMQSNSSFVKYALSYILTKLRLKRVEKQYEAIGGGSPILKWTELQGKKMVSMLKNSVGFKSDSFQHYVAFRYVQPDAYTAVKNMLDDGITHAVAFSQYPQYSCTTTGSSLTHLWKAARDLDKDKQIQWSIIDRWPINKSFVQCLVERIKSQLMLFTKSDEYVDNKDVIIVFSAHSLPISTVNRGDSYVPEVHKTVAMVINELHRKKIINRHVISWQSKVGANKWQGPQTDAMLKSLGRQNVSRVVLVPVAFTSDHVETLYEIDEEYKNLAKNAGIKEFRRTESMNGYDKFAFALNTIVQDHLNEKKNFSDRYNLKCAGCWQPETCREIVNPKY